MGGACVMLGRGRGDPAPTVGAGSPRPASAEARERLCNRDGLHALPLQRAGEGRASTEGTRSLPSA